MNGAGAAAQACMKLIYDYGFPKENCIMCDTRGVIYKGRARGINEFKARYQTEREDVKTLEDAFKGADIAIGVSQAGLFKPEMIKSMAANPVIFALANPEPEMRPE